MKLKLAEWGCSAAEPHLLKVPYRDLDELAQELASHPGSAPEGLIPPFDHANLAWSLRCLASVQDRFAPIPAYAVVPTQIPRPFIRSVCAAGYKHFLLRMTAEWPMFVQEVRDMMDRRAVHVAGGDPGIPEWTWSEEQLWFGW